MLDQAQDLRRLANCRARPETPSHGRPALVVVLGGKGGVGATTVGLNLAAALAQSGRQTLLVDADPRGGDVALLCGIEERYSLADLLEGRHTWEETVHSGPSGMKLVVGHRGWHQRSGSPEAVANQLIDRMGDPNLQADLAVIDAGNAFDGAVPHLCRMADAVLLVTTPDAASVVNTFATIKAIVAYAQESGQPHLLVNMAPNAQAAEIVHYRLARACRRLLGVDLPSAGHLEKAGSVTGNDRCRPIRLNLQVSSTDTMRRLLAADVLLNWRRHAEFNAHFSRRSTK